MKKACIISAAVLVVSLFTSCIVDVAPKSASFEVSLDLGGRSVADDVNVASVEVKAYNQSNVLLTEATVTTQPWKASITIDSIYYGEITFYAQAKNSAGMGLYAGEIIQAIDADTTRSLAIGVSAYNTISITDFNDYDATNMFVTVFLILEQGADLTSVLGSSTPSEELLSMAQGAAYSGQCPPAIISDYSALLKSKALPWYPEPLTSYDVYVQLTNIFTTEEKILLKMDGENLAPLITITAGATNEDLAFSLATDCVGYVDYTPPSAP